MDAQMSHESTLGKTVTLERGVVVTDIGPGVANGEEDELLRRVRVDDGTTDLILRRVIAELPETIRRTSFNYRPGDAG